MHYLTMCCIVKNEEESYLREWLCYHHAMGVEHFYVYDNESRIPLDGILTDYIQAGWVNVFRMPGYGVQLYAYTHCLHYLSDKTRWMGFIDLDEFILPSAQRDLRVFLADYETFGGLGINWLCYGSSGLTQKPGASQVELFIHRTPSDFPDNRHIKSIIQPQHTIAPLSPHHFLYRDGFGCVNEHGTAVDGPFSENSTMKIRINHYFLRSSEQFQAKLDRGRATGLPKRPQDQFARFDSAATILDDCILEIWNPTTQELRASLQPQNPGKNRFSHTPAGLPVDFQQPDQIDTITIDTLHLCDQALKSMQAENWPDAATILNLLLERYPTFPEGYILLSELFLKIGNPDQALHCLQTAQEIGVSSSLMARQFGNVLQHKGQHLQAQSYLLQAHQQKPTDISILIQLADNSPEIPAARQFLEQALLIEPDNPEVQASLLILET